MASTARPHRPDLPALLALIAACLATGAPAAAQHDPIAFRQLTIEDGLSQNAVSAILQDRQGFVWLGTKEGLNRYDGYSFLAFRNDPMDPGSLSDSEVTALYEDGAGVLWVGTRQGGLNALDGAAHRFRRYPDGPRHPITAITGVGSGGGGGSGGLWIATDGGGLYRFDPGTGAFDRFVHDSARPGSLAHDRVFAVLVDRAGVVWVGTETGLDRLDGAASAVAASASFVHHTADAAGPLAIIDSTVTALHEDERGRLWVGSIPGISVLSPERDSVRHHYHRYRSYRYGWGRPREMLMDRSGRLWISTASELMLLDPESGEFRYVRRDPLDPTSINSDQPTALFQDRSGVIWVGTNGFGVNLHDPKATRFHTFRRPPDSDSRMSRFSVYTLFEDSRGSLWIDAGVLYRWDRRTGELVSFESRSERPWDFGNTSVWSIIEDPDGFLWAGTQAGLYHYEIDTGRARLFARDPDRPGSLPEDEVREVFKARDGTLWVVTENYLARMVDAAAGRFESIRYTETSTRGAWSFPSLHEDSAGVLWLGSNEGLVRFDPRTGALRRFRSDPRDPDGLAHDVVRALSPDPEQPDRYLWIATAGGGLNRFDLLEERFLRFTVRDGLPNNVVYGILPDDAGNLWLSTNRGLSRFDPRRRTFRNFDAADGLQSNEFNSGAYFRSRSGELFFGGLYGFSWFRPEDVADNPHVPPVVITGFRRSNRAESVRDSGSVLAAAITHLDTLRLAHDDNVIGFEFAALDFSAPRKNRYAYRLVGFDREWVDAGPVRSATYTNLPPGWYTFRVRGSNNDGVWNEAGTSLVVRIVPPWWGTGWAYALYVLLAMAALWVLRHYELGRARLQNRLELEQVAGEKLRELDQTKSRFFADVSHEFRTPLTLTLGPLDDLLDGLHGDLEPTVREQVGLARRNSERVLDLVNQILELARLEARRTPLRAHRLDLVAFVRGVVDAFAPLAERKSLSLDLVALDVAVPLWADPEHLEKALSNLLSNAVKFTPEGGAVRVTVAADPGTARVVVRDSGPGIPAADLPRVFDRFHRVDDASRRQPGTGIGLALARELVELHGGRLTVESEPGFGSTFTLLLLRGDDHLREDQRVDDVVPAPRSLPPGASRALAVLDADGTGDAAGEAGDDAVEPDDQDVTTVLVVEDNEEVRGYLRRHLSRDYRVLEAADGEEGLALVRSRLPDLVLSDVMMPGGDGLALCRAIKASPETEFIPVVLLTARAAAEDRIAGLREEADDYLVKPFRADELQARVANLIASRKRLRERFATPAAAPGLRAAPVDVTSADELFMERVRAAIEANMGDESYTVERLARDVAHSRSQLHRRLTALLDEPPSDLIRRMRLERAAQLLDAGAGSVSSIAYAVGFKSVSHFSNRFQDRFGVRPSAWQARATR